MQNRPVIDRGSQFQAESMTKSLQVRRGITDLKNWDHFSGLQWGMLENNAGEGV